VTLVTIGRPRRWHTGRVTAAHAPRLARVGDAQLLRPHDPAWARRFARERDRLACALGDDACRIEHIGSTAVPDLAADPVIDVMVTVRDVEEHRSWQPALEALGYVSVDPRALCSADRAVHVHICAAGGEDERRHILFRDRLRASAKLRRTYEALRRGSAAKRPFIERTLADAR
jgi:GrpB-like predicted nucleotidyltransferase (UPF0157 family)